MAVPLTNRDGISLASGTADVSSRHTKLVIKSSAGSPTVRKTPGPNTDTPHAGLITTSDVPQSPTGEIGLAPVSPTDSTEEIASRALDVRISCPLKSLTLTETLALARRIRLGCCKNPRRHLLQSS
jgi:hypothetical protein